MHDTKQTSSELGQWMPALLAQVSERFEDSSPQHVLSWASETFGEGLTIGTAFGVSGMVLIDMAMRACPDGVDVFYIDTGLFFPETYTLIERAEARYGVKFRRLTPAQSVAAQADAVGDKLWERDPDACCRRRKVVPLSEALEGRTAWVTGLRRDQSPTRRHTPIISWNARRQIVKVAPLANWTEKDIWRYALANDVPYNPLHNQGFPSIGCQPCTRSVRDGEDMRAGRWSGRAKTECGLHL